MATLMASDERIDHLSEHLAPIGIPTHYPPPKIKRIAVRLSRTLGNGPTAWLFDRAPSVISRWRNQAVDGEDDYNLDRRPRGGMPRGGMCGTR